MFGDINQIGVTRAVLMIGQLIIASMLVLLMDEMMNKKYGIGSGISLFIAVNVAENLLWKVYHQ